MEPEHGSGNSKPSTSIHAQPSYDDDDGDPVVKGKMSRASSSSSSSSSFNPLTDSDDGEKEIHNTSITKLEQIGPMLPVPGAVTLPESPAQTPEWSMISASPRAGPGHLLSQELSPQNPEWSMLTASPKQYPPIQTMGRPGTSTGYDPNRIPSSVFAPKPANPMEWSVASNESLFSIHMGNNSFSKDNAILMGKSEELGKADDFSYLTSTHKPVTEAKSDDFNNSPAPLPTVIEVAAVNDRKSDMEESGVKQVADEKPMVVKKTTKDPCKEINPPAEGVRISNNGSNASDGKETPHSDGARISASTARLSDGSGTSSSSFAFPVFMGEGGRSASVRVAPENLQQKPPEKPQRQSQPQSQSEPQPQAQAVNLDKTAETRWFTCFSCRLLCC